MKEWKFTKTNIVGGKVDDIVKNLKELKEKSKLLDGCIYENGMLILVEEQKAIYRAKEA